MQTIPRNEPAKATSLETFLAPYLPALETAVKTEDEAQIINICRKLALECEHGDFRCYLLALAKAIETDRWELISEYFLANRFIFDGIVFLFAPLQRRINGEDVTKPTLVVGWAREYANVAIEEVAIRIFRTLTQPIPKLLSIHVLASAGNIGGQEAFVPSGGWMLPESDRGVSILCENLHRERFDHSIRRRIQQNWEPKAAELLVSAITDTNSIVREYIKHEEGHALGLGIDLKNQLDLFKNPHLAGYEEYKTDIVGFRLAAEVFPPEIAGKLVACTLLIRWGVDFIRPGAPLEDHDAMSALLLLDRLLQSEEVFLTSDRRLALREVSFEGLFRATAIHRREAEELVREELSRLDAPISIVSFYAGKTIHPETIALHRELIDRCRNTL